MNNNKSIAILLASYNGERYIEEQIKSLLDQTLQGWTLYVHDDGSKDQTLEVVKKIAREHPQIKVLDYPAQGCAKNNFFSLVEKVDADYYFFCDQDDKWLPEKMQKTMDRMIEIEINHPDVPVVVHSDLCVVDESLNVVDRSFLKYSGIHPEFLATFSEAGVSGLVTGCTMCFNSEAKSCMQYPLDAALMHDEWITLCTLRAGGIVSLVNEPLMLYRQHTDNVLGAKDRTKLTLGSRLNHFSSFLKNHFRRYAMLKSLGYGSYLKFIYYKFLLRHRIRHCKN